MAEESMYQIAKELAKKLGIDTSDLDPPHLSDVGNATMLRLLHGEDLRYCWPWKCWLVWDDTRWKQDKAGLIDRYARDVAAKYHQMVGQLNEKASDLNTKAATAPDLIESQELAEQAIKLGKVAEAYSKWAKVCESERAIKDMVELAKSEEGITILPEDLDRDNYLLNFPNGTLDLRTDEFREHRRDDYLTKMTVTRHVEGARRPEIDELLELAIPNPNVREWWLRTLARGLEGNPSDIVTLLHGIAGTGKTTVTEGLLQALGEDYAISVRLDTLTGKRYAGNAEPDLARLAGKRFVFVPEAENAGGVMDLLKMVTGGTSTPTRDLYERTGQFIPRFTMVLSANKRPALPADDSGAQRRLREIAFQHRFPDDESVRADLIDPVASGPAWVALLTAAHRRWREEGMLPEPDELIRQTAKFWTNMGSIQEYLDERTRLDPDSPDATPVSVLFPDYVEWALGKGLAAPERPWKPGQHLGSKGFSRQLVKRAPSVNTKAARSYRGVFLKDGGAVIQGGLLQTDDRDGDSNTADNKAPFAPEEAFTPPEFDPTGWELAPENEHGDRVVPEGSEVHVDLQTGVTYYRIMSERGDSE